MHRRRFLSSAAGILGGAVLQSSTPVNLVRPLANSGVRITDVRANIARVHRPYVIVRITTDAGIMGIGDGSLEYNPLSVVQAVEELKYLLIGQDPTLIEHHWQRMYRHSFYRAGPVLMSAFGGIDTALWDITGKIYNQPVYKLLGGPVRNKIRMYIHAGGDTTDGLIETAQLAYEAGYRGVKTSPPGPVSLSENPAFFKNFITRLEKLRAVMGDDFAIMVDCHGRLSPTVASILATELEPLHLLFLEEPVLPENPEALTKVAAESTTPIGMGRRIHGLFGFREYFENNLIDVAQPGMSTCGGITQMQKIAAMAEAYYISVAPTNISSPISTVACMHVDAAIPNFLIQEVPGRGWGNPRRLEALQDFAERPVDGYLQLPDKPGLGVELNEEIFEKYPYEGPSQLPPREMFYPDSSVADR
jgi:galactonate dehydratase